MYCLGFCASARIAQAFIDYMASKQIEVKIGPAEAGQCSVWVVNPRDKTIAEMEFHAFLSEPTHTKYRAASWETGSLGNRNIHYFKFDTWGALREKTGPVTWVVLLLCITIYGGNGFGFSSLSYEWFHFPETRAQSLEVWRWLSHALIHFSIVHICFNVIWWLQLGGMIEKRLGMLKLMQLFTLSSLLSGCAQWFFSGIYFGGLSGVVYGALGYIWMLGYYAPHRNLSLPRPVIGIMLIWLILGFAISDMNIANAAHVVGLLSGVALGYVDAMKAKRDVS